MSIQENSTETDNSAKEPTMFNYESNQYYGVGGWLLLFCVGLTIIGPLMKLGGIGSSFAELEKLGGRFPSLVTVVYIENAMELGLAIFSIYAGVCLWSVKANAVYIAKVFLVTVFIFAVFDLFLVMMAGFPEPAASLSIKEGFMGIVRSAIYAGVWFAYLSNSKRVRATYNLPF